MCFCCCDEKYQQFFLRLHRLALFLVGVFGMVCSGYALGSCRLIEYDSRLAPTVLLLLDPDDENGEEEVIASLLVPRNGVAYFGLFRYDPDGNGCRHFSWEDDLVPSWGGQDAEVAQALCMLVMILSFGALLIIWVEYLCCRFCCGRFLASFLLVLAAFSQSSAFLLLNAPLCRIEKREDDDVMEEEEEEQDPNTSYPFPCDIANGSYVVMAAMVTYVFAAMLVCATAKPEPVCKTLREMDENDPCICPCRRKKTEGGEEGDIGDEEDQGADDKDGEKDESVDDDDDDENVGKDATDEVLDPLIIPKEPYGNKQGQDRPYKGNHQDAIVVDNDLFFDSKSRRSLSFNFGSMKGAGVSEMESAPQPQPEYSSGEKPTPSEDPPSSRPSILKSVSLMVADSAT